MTTMIKAIVTTSTYERTWGHKPRGRGFWLFAMTTPDGRRGQFSHSGTYTESLRQARAYATREGADTIEVMP